MNIIFYIDKPQRVVSPIMMAITFEGYRLKLSTKKSIKPELWDDEKEKVKKNTTNTTEINTYLDKIKGRVGSIYIEAKALGIDVSPTYFKKKIADYLQPKKIDPKVKVLSFDECFNKFISERRNDSGYKPRTIKHYETAYHHLVGYAKANRIKLTFDMMNKEFYDKFCNYLTRNKMHTVNTVGSVIKTIKSFLHYSLKNKYGSSIEFIEHFKVHKKNSQGVALTFEDISKLESVELSNLKYDKVRDMFLFLIYSGLRFSDLYNLTPENFYLSDEVITIQVIKTQEPQNIVIHDRFKRLIEKYPDLKFPKISGQKFNDYIKDVCKLAGIDTPTQTTKYYGKKRVDGVKPKYALIASHCGRRSFITLMLKMGVLPELVMKASGHKSRASFEKYVIATREEALDAVKNAWDNIGKEK